MRTFTILSLLLASGTVFATIPTGGYTSFLGGRSDSYGNEGVFGVAVDADGYAYAAGLTESELPAGARRYGDGIRGGFVTQIDPAGTARTFTTFFAQIDLIAMKLGPGNTIYALGQTGQSAPDFVTLGAHAGGYTEAVLLKLSAAGELLWARFLGGNDLEVPRALAVDAGGNAYAAGYTTSTNFETTAGAALRTPSGGFDGFLAKVSADGALIYSTYLGGSGSESALALAIDSQGRAIVTGATVSADFAGLAPQQFGGGGTDAFVCRVNPQGTAFDWLTRIGGTGRDSALSVAFAANGEIVVLGITESEDFPVTASALQPALSGESDLFLARLSPDGRQLGAATYLGGANGEDLGDPFYVRYTLDGETEERSIFPETAALALAADGVIYVTARSSSADWSAAPFPFSHAGNRDGYLARVSENLSALLGLEFFGGAADDELRTIALDANGNAYLGGTTAAPSYPPFLATSPGAFQPSYGGSAMDGLLIKVPAIAAPLAGDAFSGRIPLAGDRVGASVRMDGASLEPGEPPHPAGLSNSVWFTWRAPASGRAILWTTASTFDARLEAWSGASLPALALLGAGESGRLVIPVAAGTDYQLALLGASAPGAIGRLSLAFSEPPNDDQADAILLTGFPVSAEGSNVHSTSEPGEPGHAGAIPVRSVWWKWVAPQSLSVAVTTAESTFDTVVAVYTPQADSLLPVASGNNVSAEDRTSEAVFLAESGKTYLIAVDGPPDETGAIRLRLVSNEPPANDNFTNAAPLPGIRLDLTASNRRATFEPGEPMLAFTNALAEVDANFGGATLWWSWVASAAGRARVHTLGSDFDTRLAIYTGASLTNLQRVAAHDDVDRALGQRASAVDFPTAEGQKYFIQVDGSSGDLAGVIQLHLRLSFPPRILGPTLSRTAGELRFQAAGEPGVAYRYETSRDLKAWTASAGAVAEIDGIWSFVVPAGDPGPLFVRLSAPE